MILDWLARSRIGQAAERRTTSHSRVASRRARASTSSTSAIVVTEAADVSDLDLLENYLTQQRKKQAREADAAVNAKNTASNKRK